MAGHPIKQHFRYENEKIDYRYLLLDTAGCMGFFPFYFSDFPDYFT
jgi:hypothetical protein